jgi:hypothetical protein
MKKIVLSIFLLICLALIAVFINYQLGLSTKYNYLSARRDLSKVKIQLISSGLPRCNFNPVAKKYGFLVVEEGCTLFTIEENGIKQYNTVVNKYLAILNGVNWEAKYRKDCDSLYKTIFQ